MERYVPALAGGVCEATAHEAADYISCTPTSTRRAVQVTRRTHGPDSRILQHLGVQRYRESLMPQTASLQLDITV